ncbi:MAG: type II toxin-antitoxin system VapB family antitoxin [Tunicatimonas sp.]
MRTNIEIDDQLMQKAMKLSNTKTKKETVEEALKALIQVEQQKNMLGLIGTVVWEGNLAEMRYD